MTAETIESAIGKKTRAVVLVHLFGRPAELTSIKELLDQRGITLIEDCSQAHFAEFDGCRVGTFGDFGCFSLQQAKQITCGDGGFTLIKNDDLAERARLFVDKGWNRRSGTRAHEFLGINYRMTEMQGAVAHAQLNKLERLIEVRRKMANRLYSDLQSTRGMVLPPASEVANPSWWIFNFCIDETELGINSDSFSTLVRAERDPSPAKLLAKTNF